MLARFEVTSTYANYVEYRIRHKEFKALSFSYHYNKSSLRKFLKYSHNSRKFPYGFQKCFSLIERSLFAYKLTGAI